jgi:hypothetical protein
LNDRDTGAEAAVTTSQNFILSFPRIISGHNGGAARARPVAPSRFVVSKAAVYVLEKSGYVKVVARAAEER